MRAVPRTTLSRLVLALSVVICLSALNPAQGSLMAGITGLMFSVLPMLGFWIGRSILDDGLFRRILRWLAWFGLAAALYGLYQTTVGFPAWDAKWLAESGYAALNVDGVKRAFGFGTSAAEYTTFLGIALVVWLKLDSRKLLLAVPVAGLIGWAIFLESTRGAVVMVVLTLGVLAAVRRRLPLPAAAAAGVLALGLLVWGAGQLQATAPTKAHGALVDHQLDGLANPLDRRQSTVQTHYGYFTDGLMTALHEPLGRGIGAVTIAGQKYDAERKATEFDPSNMAVAAGVPGLVLYVALAAAVLVTAFRAARRHPRDPLVVLALAIPLLMTFNWLNGGMYGPSFVCWLVIGWIDRRAVQAIPALETTTGRSTS